MDPQSCPTTSFESLPCHVQELITSQFNTKTKAAAACATSSIKIDPIPHFADMLQALELCQTNYNTERDRFQAPLTSTGYIIDEPPFPESPRNSYRIRFDTFVKAMPELKAQFTQCPFEHYPVVCEALFIKMDQTLHVEQMKVNINAAKIQQLPANFVFNAVVATRTRASRNQPKPCANVLAEKSLIHTDFCIRTTHPFNLGLDLPNGWLLALLIHSRKVAESLGFSVELQDQTIEIPEEPMAYVRKQPGFDSFRNVLLKAIYQAGGGKATYKGRKYKVRFGSRGGKYILVNSKKIYIK